MHTKKPAGSSAGFSVFGDMENETPFPYKGFSPKSVCNVVGRTGSIEVEGRILHFKIVAQEEFAIQDGVNEWHIPLVHNGHSQIGDLWKDGSWCDGLAWDKEEMEASRASRPYIKPGWVAPWMGRADTLFGLILRMLFQVVNAELDRAGICHENSSYEDDYIFEKDGQVFISEWLSKQTKK